MMKDFISAAAKRLLPVLFVISSIPILFARGPESFARDAQNDYLAGDYESARAKFELLLDEHSKSAMAQKYLAMIAAAEVTPAAKTIVQLRKLKAAGGDPGGDARFRPRIPSPTDH